MCAVKSSELHIRSITRRDGVVRFEVLQNAPNTPRSLQSDRLAPIELSLIPVHLTQSQHLSRKSLRRLLNCVTADKERNRHVHPGIGCEKINAATRVEHVVFRVQREQSAT